MVRAVESYDLSNSALKLQRIFQIGGESLSRQDIEEMIEEHPAQYVKDVDGSLEELEDKNWITEEDGEYKVVEELEFKGEKLGKIGVEAENVVQTILADNVKDYEKLQITGLKFEETDKFLVLNLKLKYKDSENGDRYDYAHTEFIPALKFPKAEDWQLIQKFSLIASDKNQGFAGFQKNSTRTMSPLDQIKELTLPETKLVKTD